MFALLTVLLLVATSCNLQRAGQAPADEDEHFGYGAGLLDGFSEEEERDAPAPLREQSQANPDAPGVHAEPRRSEPGAPPPTPRQIPARPNDFGALGTNNYFYLRSDIPRLVIEINAASNAQPDPTAVEVLRTRLSQVLDKPGGIEVRPVNTFGTTKSTYTMGDVQRLEELNRSQFSSDDTIVMHVLYLNGELEGRPALGVAYGSTSFVIFKDMIERAATPAVSARRIESAVIVHEAGHVLSLVNIGYQSPRDHEDPDNPGHSRHRDSVMYWAVETLSVASILTGGPSTEFHADDLADLEDLKAGRL